MRRHLIDLGVPAQKVVRKRDTGYYIADFYVPDMATPTRPAREWSLQIENVLPDAAVIDTLETIATWRTGSPVIYASVIFRLDGE